MSAAPPPVTGVSSVLHSALPAPTFASSFDRLAARGDDEIDVAWGAALIARDAYARLDARALLERFDDLAQPLLGAGLPAMTPEEQAKTVGEHLFVTLGFKGNEADYYDPRNSLLPDVLDRKLGIPITLALVFIEVSRRLGVHARGVSFPGHFLVRVEAPVGTIGASPVFVDPFFGGRLLDRDALERLLKRSTSTKEDLKDEHLAPCTARAMLMRMLVNLKWIYQTRGDLARAHLALDRIVSLSPNQTAAIRERGMLAARLGAVEAARADLARLLEIDPDAADAKSIRARLAELESTRRVLN
jgi:regulator of sirC expression with transglutaminase-like and TPR domain